MRKSYMVYISDMIADLKLSSTQTNFVVKSYKSLYKNSYDTISIDVQMQTMCKKMLDRFNRKLKDVNLHKLSTYRYLLI